MSSNDNTTCIDDVIHQVVADPDHAYFKISNKKHSRAIDAMLTLFDYNRYNADPDGDPPPLNGFASVQAAADFLRGAGSGKTYDVDAPAFPALRFGPGSRFAGGGFGGGDFGSLPAPDLGGGGLNLGHALELATTGLKLFGSPPLLGSLSAAAELGLRTFELGPLSRAIGIRMASTPYGPPMGDFGALTEFGGHFPGWESITSNIGTPTSTLGAIPPGSNLPPTAAQGMLPPKVVPLSPAAAPGTTMSNFLAGIGPEVAGAGAPGSAAGGFGASLGGPGAGTGIMPALGAAAAAAAFATFMTARSAAKVDPTAEARSANELENFFQRGLKSPEAEEEEIRKLQRIVSGNPNQLALIQKAARGGDVPPSVGHSSGGTKVVGWQGRVPALADKHMDRLTAAARLGDFIQARNISEAQKLVAKHPYLAEGNPNMQGALSGLTDLWGNPAGGP